MQIEPDRTSQASFDYVVGLKRYVAEKLTPRLRTAYEIEERGYAQTHNGEKPATMEQVGEVMRPMTLYRYNRAIQRVSQELMWAVVFESLEPRRAELVEELNRPTVNALGSVETDPDLELPKYYTAVDFHLQPRSYHGDELAGIVYDIGVPIYVMRRNGPDSGQSGRALASVIPPGRNQKILDLGCDLKSGIHHKKHKMTKNTKIKDRSGYPESHLCILSFCVFCGESSVTNYTPFG
jgi:hypothetical protein